MTPHEKTKRCAARFIYRKADKATPSGNRTWREWFALKFGEDYDSYVKKLIAEKEGNA